MVTCVEKSPMAHNGKCGWAPKNVQCKLWINYNSELRKSTKWLTFHPQKTKQHKLTLETKTYIQQIQCLLSYFIFLSDFKWHVPSISGSNNTAKGNKCPPC